MPSQFASHWTLDPAITFLNHGSYGATPRPVLRVQQAWRDRIEREPMAFFARDFEPAMDVVRRVLADFVGAAAGDLALVPNATAAIGTVTRSIDLRPGEEVVTTDHAYPAARNALADAAGRAGARLVVAPVPFPGATPDAAHEAVLAAVTPRTRLVLLDHVTSATALVLPVAEIVALLAERGIDTLVDGAHAPGMLELDLDAIGAAYYAGDCHKWLSAPKGAGFLHVRRDRQDAIRPLALSHGATSTRSDRGRFRLEHDWTGTADPTAHLAVPAAIEFGASLLAGGWRKLQARNRALALRGRTLLCEALDVPAPATDEMIGSMVTVALPIEGDAGERSEAAYGDPLHDALLAHGVQVAVAAWPQEAAEGVAWRRLVRVSVAPYVDLDDLERLATLLPRALADARRSLRIVEA